MPGVARPNPAPPSSPAPAAVVPRWMYRVAVARGGLKTACVGVGVALGWPLANQLPGVAGHPRPTWSTSPNIHIDLVVLADGRTPPPLRRRFHPLGIPPPTPVRALLLRPRREPPKKVEPDQRARHVIPLAPSTFSQPPRYAVRRVAMNYDSLRSICIPE